MNESLYYSLQTILSAGLFILIYRLFVRNSNAYNWNRCYLLSTMILSFFLPFIDISNWFTVEKPIIFYASMIDLDQAFTVSPMQQVQTSLNLSDLIMTGYWIIVGLFLLRFGWGITRIIEMAKSNNYTKSGTLRLYHIKRKTTFSFFNYIFIQPEHWEKPAIDYIIRHEQAHVNQLHTIDNILAEIILVFGWFNPFYYIYRRDLHLLHECQADQEVINSGCDQTTYHQMLLNEVSGNITYIIVNQFSYSLIKRRFKMISKNKQSRLAGFRILLAIPTAFALLLLFSFTSLEKTTSLLKSNLLQPTMQAVQSSLDNMQIPQQKTKTKDTIKATLPENKGSNIVKTNDDKPFILVEQNPEFRGGYKTMLKYLSEKINFPELAKQSGIQGTVFVQFVVGKTGKISKTKILRGIGGGCDEEAIRVVNEMPDWIPGKQNGQDVPVMFQIPIKFQQTKQNSEDKEYEPFVLVEQNPEFKGGYEAMLKFLKDKIQYPVTAQQSKVQGTVFVQFVVGKTGKISAIKILRGIGSGCDEEAIRVVKEMPDWIPGKQNGQVVPVMFQIPVKFQFKAF